MKKETRHNFDWLKDPKVFQINRIKAHSDHSYCTQNASDEELRYNLNGYWKFYYAKNLMQAHKEFFAQDYDVTTWGEIKVPAHIEMQGYDHPHYVNTMYPWDGHERIMPPEIPTIYNPVGSYVKYFQVPDSWQDGPVYISFQGVESAFYVWLNGEFVGYSEDSFTPAEFDLTPFIKEGQNKLAVMVFKWSSGSWLEDQDFWRFSGIFRDVYLYTVPSVHVEDARVVTDLCKEYKDGVLVVDGKLSYQKSQNINIRYTLFDVKGNTVFTYMDQGISEDHFQLRKEVKRPKLWSSESPYLYRLAIDLMDADSEDIIETVTQKVGFRKFEMIDKIMHINGKRIVFRGVNRHEFSAYSGRCVSREEMLWDIKFLKQNNFNSVRTSHYPNHSLWYELCDEYGIYLIDEANIESHGTWQLPTGNSDAFVVPGDNYDWLGCVIDRAESMLERDKNHPSILIWSCGNESYGGKVLYQMSEYFRNADPTRLVHYESVFHDRRYNNTSDMESRMYATVEDAASYLENKSEKPYVLCEYTHAMGNSNGAMYKYIELEDQFPMYQGGFIWDYIDQGIVTKDRYGKDYIAYGGDFDDRPTNYNFCINGIVYADRKPSPKMQEVKYLYQEYIIAPKEDQVTIRNKSLFTNTDQYDCQWMVKKEGEIFETGTLAADVGPGETKTFTLHTTKEKPQGEYTVLVRFVLKDANKWAEAGHEVAFGEYTYQVGQVQMKETDKKVTVAHGDWNIGIRGDGFHVIFSKELGALTCIKYYDKEMLKHPMQPNFWRATTDNDRGTGLIKDIAQWKIAGLYAKCVDVKVTKKETQATIACIYNLATIPRADLKVNYTVNGEGKVTTQMTYEGAELNHMPAFGMTFKMAKDYDNVKWYGNGPEETYQDRKSGAKIGIYQNKVEDNMARYVIPQECGNKTEVRWAEITDLTGAGVKIAGDIPFEFSALPYTCHELDNAYHHYELPVSHYTVFNINKVQMGVGGDDSWMTQVHEEYRIPANKALSFTFSIEKLEK